MSEPLTTNDFRVVQSLLWKDKVKWYYIGVQLHLQVHQLEAIRHNFDTVEDRFTQMLLEWLRQDKPRPTWEALVSALRSDPVDCENTAAEIEKLFIPIPKPVLYVHHGELLDDSVECDGVFTPSERVQEMKQDLDQKFGKMVTKTYDVLVEEKKMTLSFLRSRFSTFPSTRRHEHQEFLDKYIFEIDHNLTAEGLWLKFCKYWHFLNYNLLKFIIDAIGKDSLVMDMNKYEMEMAQFCEETSLLDFVKSFPELFRRGIPKDYQNFEVKISSKRNELKLVHLNRLENACVATFSLPKICGLILKAVTHGCFLVTWLVPALYSRLLRWKLSICHEKFFEEHDIQCVSLEKEVCYQKGSERTPINPAHEVASNTTITEEVFELRNMMEKVMRSSPPFTMTQLCTAYVCKILTQYLSSQGKKIIIKSLAKLSPEVCKKFLKLCKVACKKTIQDINTVGTYSLHNDGLGLTSCVQGSHQVFLHRTLQHYLAALYVVDSNSPRVLEVITARVEHSQHSYLYYFIAGLASDKEWIYESLLKSFQDHINKYILQFEVGNLRSLKKVEALDVQTQSSLLTTVQNLITDSVPSLQSLTDFKFMEWGAPLHVSFESKAAAIKFTMHIVGYTLYFGSSVWQIQNRWGFPIVKGITRGLIAALENSCKCEAEFPSEDLKLNIEVITSDMEYLMKMPLNMLEKTQILKLLPNCFQDLRPISSVGLVLECATFMAELFEKDCYIEEFELKTRHFDSDALDTIIHGLQHSKHLRTLKFCEDLTVDHLSSLSESLKKEDSTIAELCVDQCGIEDEGAFELAEMLMENTSLKVLSITGGNNTIGSRSVGAIAKSLQVNDQLKTLDLRAVQLNSEGARSMGKMLSVNHSLQTLCLDHSNIEYEGASGLAEGLAVNETLQVLELCGTSDSNLVPLVSALKGGSVSTALSVVISSSSSPTSQRASFDSAKSVAIEEL